MKTLIAVAAAVVFGGAYHLASDAPDEGPVKTVAARAPGNSYSLVVPGKNAACTVTKGRRLSEQLAEIKLSQGCGMAYDELAKAAIWREENGGDVAFTTEEGSTLVRFSAGDGVAYESYRPSVPFISLIAKR